MRLQRTLLIITIFVLSICSNYQIFAQEISVEIGKTEIALNEVLQITATVTNGQMSGAGGFPEIKGFNKVGTSSSSYTNIINGRITQSQSIIQNYKPTKEGTFQVPPFSMSVNGKSVSFGGATIKVGPAAQQKDPWDAFFGFENDTPENIDYVNVKEDAFFAITTNKDEVFVGEGFNVSIAMYIADQNQATMEWYETGQQLTEILKKIKPSNCWEENFSIEEIIPERVNIRGKGYRQYKIYQANFYPLNNKPVVFPSVEFKMIKFKMANKPSFFGSSYQKDFTIFLSNPKTVKINNLPEHPLKNQVAVGNYKLEEAISSPNLTTGQSFEYKFKVVGEGNISAIREVATPKVNDFDFYAPNVKQQINRGGGAVYGSKLFTYMAIPKEPGNYDLGKYFNWIYFNPTTKQYDTLTATTKINVTGESKMNVSIEANDRGGFYDLIDEQEDTLVSMNRDEAIKGFTNMGIGFLLIITAFFALKKVKNEEKLVKNKESKEM
ncbi:MAG: BatD family protein [Thermoflexibacter sp.]|nr:BatD family protein [Thermoflexibacter sp.]